MKWVSVFCVADGVTYSMYGVVWGMVYGCWCRVWCVAGVGSGVYAIVSGKGMWWRAYWWWR